MEKESVRRHLKGVNKLTLWLFTEFYLGVKGRREERPKAVFCFVWDFSNLIARNTKLAID